MAARKPRLAKTGAARGVLAANVHIHGGGPDGEDMWFGPSYPENGEPPAELAATLPAHVWDTRKVWPTPDDAAAVGLAWDEPESAVDPAAVSDEKKADGDDGKGGS